MSEKDKNERKIVQLRNFEDVKELIRKTLEARAQKLKSLNAEDAKTFTSMVMSLTVQLVQRAKQKQGDERIVWSEFLSEMIKESNQKKDLGAVLTFLQNNLVVYESIMEEGNLSVLTLYCRQMYSLSMLNAQLNIPKSNEPLAQRAAKYVMAVQSREQLECLIAVIEKNALQQFAQKNFDVAEVGHKKIYEARERALSLENIMSEVENSEGLLKLSQIKTTGNLLAALIEQKKSEEALEYFAKAKAISEEPVLAELMETMDGHRTMGSLSMVASSAYNQMKDREQEKALLKEALKLVMQNIENTAVNRNVQDSLYRRRIEQLMALNEENQWYHTSEEYRLEVQKVISEADALVKESAEHHKDMSQTAMLTQARKIEEAIIRMEELHAVDVVLSPSRYYKFCQICADLNRMGGNVASITKFWYKKTVELMEEMKKDAIAFDQNDMIFALFYMSRCEESTDSEKAGTYLTEAVLTGNQLLQAGRIRDKHLLAVCNHTLAISYLKKNDTVNTKKYATVAYDIWQNMVNNEGRSDLQNNLEQSRKLIEACK